jgi:hypothetical protein
VSRPPTPRRPQKAAAPPPTPPRDNVPGRITPDPVREAHAAETLAEIAALSRAPFRRILQLYAGAAPSPEALAAQAEKFPDRWAQGLAIAGRLAGYTEKLEIEGSVDVHHLHRLSDMELEAEIAALEATLTAPPHDGPKRLPPGPPAAR